MSEDSDSISKNKPQKDPYKPGCGPDLYSSLGKGMLATESMRNAPGLTPLHVVNEIRERKTKSDSVDIKFSATEGTKTLRNSAGLTPLSPLGRFTKEGYLR